MSYWRSQLKKSDSGVSHPSHLDIVWRISGARLIHAVIIWDSFHFQPFHFKIYITAQIWLTDIRLWPWPLIMIIFFSPSYSNSSVTFQPPCAAHLDSDVHVHNNVHPLHTGETTDIMLVTGPQRPDTDQVISAAAAQDRVRGEMLITKRLNFSVVETFNIMNYRLFLSQSYLYNISMEF